MEKTLKLSEQTSGGVLQAFERFLTGCKIRGFDGLTGRGPEVEAPVAQPSVKNADFGEIAYVILPK